MIFLKKVWNQNQVQKIHLFSIAFTTVALLLASQCFGEKKLQPIFKQFVYLINNVQCNNIVDEICEITGSKPRSKISGITLPEP